VLTGNLNNKKRQEIIAALNAGQVKVLLATGQLIGEGFDCPGLSTLFLATPIRHPVQRPGAAIPGADFTAGAGQSQGPGL